MTPAYSDLISGYVGESPGQEESLRDRSLLPPVVKPECETDPGKGKEILSKDVLREFEKRGN